MPGQGKSPVIGAAGGETDSESGNQGESMAKALFALDAMFRRGLIPEAQYRTRRAEIEAGADTVSPAG